MKKITVGRDSGCDIVVSDPNLEPVISRVHAEITLSGVTYFYRDMSMNGTVINGRKVHNEEISIEYGIPVILAGKIPLIWERVDALLPCPVQKTKYPDVQKGKTSGPNSYLQSVDFKELLFSFKGRVNRSTYLTYSLAIGAINLILLSFAFMVNKELFIVLYWLLLLAAVWPGLALSVKRCHDRNKSGWFFLVALVPLLSIWYFVEIYFLKGSNGSNQYGNEPEYNTDMKQYTVIAVVLFVFSYIYFIWLGAAHQLIS